MPVEGLPDPALHKRCFRCGGWFDEMDGTWVAKPRHGPGGAVLALVDRLIGDRPQQFMCDACHARADRNALMMVVALLVVIAGLAAYVVLT